MLTKAVCMLNLFPRLGSLIGLLILGLGLLTVENRAFANQVSTDEVQRQRSQSCPTNLEAAIDRIVNRPQFNRSRWGILIQPLTSTRPLYSLNSRNYFTPASNVKLLTTAAALLKLGPQFRIRTSVYRTDSPSTVTSLRVVGRGDPTLTTAHLQNLAQQLKSRGITETQLLIEDIPAPAINPTWEWEDVYAYYGVAVNSVILNQNAFTLTLLPRRLGQPVQVQWSDPVAVQQWRIDNYAITAPAETPYGVEITGVLGQPVLKIEGELAIDSEPDRWDLAIADPGRYFLETFRRVLLGQGITVTEGEVVYSPSNSLGEELAAIESPPLAALVQETNQESNNLYAEVLRRLLGTTAVESGDVLTQVLTELGVNPEGYRLVDGSGLSRQNLLSPEAVVQTLQAMAQTPYGAIYRDSLPTAGVSGTLRRRFQESALQGHLRAKTGTLQNVSVLSGYLDVPNDQLVFSIMLNQSNQPSDIQRAAIDEIVEVLSRLRFCE